MVISTSDGFGWLLLLKKQQVLHNTESPITRTAWLKVLAFSELATPCGAGLPPFLPFSFFVY